MTLVRKLANGLVGGLIGAVAGALYGVINDQVTVTISPEYFPSSSIANSC